MVAENVEIEFYNNAIGFVLEYNIERGKSKKPWHVKFTNLLLFQSNRIQSCIKMRKKDTNKFSFPLLLDAGLSPFHF